MTLKSCEHILTGSKPLVRRDKKAKLMTSCISFCVGCLFCDMYLDPKYTKAIPCAHRLRLRRENLGLQEKLLLARTHNNKVQLIPCFVDTETAQKFDAP